VPEEVIEDISEVEKNNDSQLKQLFFAVLIGAIAGALIMFLVK
jgi:hypothetical protein